MRILKFFSRFIICVLCVFALHTAFAAETNLPTVGDYGNWLTEENISLYRNKLSNNLEQVKANVDSTIHSSTFVPIEARIGLMLMKALSAIAYLLQASLVEFIVIFLLAMYAFWIGLESYKIMRESGNVKDFIYTIIKQGFIIVIWVLVLEYGPNKIFSDIVEPILAFGRYFSEGILTTVAGTYNTTMSTNCDAIHTYINQNQSLSFITNGSQDVALLLNPAASANIMCLPAQMSSFFYNAISTSLGWIVKGFASSLSLLLIGCISVYIFIKCIFKYAFMTIGIVADLFLTLLMLPFTALAESMPKPSDKENKNYAILIFNGLLKVFNTKKLSAVIIVFINAAMYFISLSIIIAICSALMYFQTQTSEAQTAISTILTGALILYLADKTDEWAEKLGGKLDNTLGKKLEGDAKTLWGDAKGAVSSIYKKWVKK